MEIYPCNCSWGILGVESLPNHTHHYVSTWFNPSLNDERVVACHLNVGRPGDPGWVLMEIKESITIWVDYRALSRGLAGLFHP